MLALRPVPQDAYSQGQDSALAVTASSKFKQPEKRISVAKYPQGERRGPKCPKTQYGNKQPGKGHPKRPAALRDLGPQNPCWLSGRCNQPGKGPKYPTGFLVFG